MNWKHFLKPDKRKVVVFVILYVLTSSIPNEKFGIPQVTPILTYFGFPFTQSGGRYKDLPFMSEYSTEYINPLAYIGNTIVWYLISCLIIWIYGKLKKK